MKQSYQYETDLNIADIHRSHMIAIKILPYQNSGSIYKVSILNAFFTRKGGIFRSIFDCISGAPIKSNFPPSLCNCGINSLSCIMCICSIYMSIYSCKDLQAPAFSLFPSKAIQIQWQRLYRVVLPQEWNTSSPAWVLHWQQQSQFFHAMLPRCSALFWYDYLMIWGDNSFFMPLSTLMYKLIPATRVPITLD